MGNHHAHTALEEYINSSYAPRYAIMLTGPWGSGKSWFIKNEIESLAKHGKRILYISTYGMSSIKDIATAIYQQIHPLMSSRPAFYAKAALRVLLKTTVNIDVNSDGATDLSLNFENFRSISSESQYINDEYVCFFDDIERCKIPHHELFGYMHLILEECNGKIILIANEEKLLNATATGIDKYSIIKEKIIGKTIRFSCDIQSAIRDFTNEIPDEESRKTIQRNESHIINIFNATDHKNLRSLRHALLEYSNIFTKVDKKYKSNTTHNDDLLHSVIVLTFASRNYGLLASDMPESSFMIEYVLQNEKEANPTLYELSKNYIEFNWKQAMLSPRSLLKIINEGYADPSAINSEISNSSQFHYESAPTWVKLWHYSDLTDDEFPAIFKEVHTEFNEHKIDNVFIILHIYGIFISLADNNIVNIDYQKIRNTAQSNITRLGKTDNMMSLSTHHESFEDTSWNGLGFQKKDTKQFQDILSFTKNTLREIYEENKKLYSNRLLDALQNGDTSALSNLYFSNNGGSLYYNTSILNKIPPLQFISDIEKLNPHYFKTLTHAISRRYSIKGFEKNLLPELEWLNIISGLLTESIEKHQTTILAMRIRRLKETIKEAITYLEAYQQNAQKQND